MSELRNQAARSSPTDPIEAKIEGAAKDVGEAGDAKQALPELRQRRTPGHGGQTKWTTAPVGRPQAASRESNLNSLREQYEIAITQATRPRARSPRTPCGSGAGGEANAAGRPARAGRMQEAVNRAWSRSGLDGGQRTISREGRREDPDQAFEAKVGANCVKPRPKALSPS